MPSFEDQFNIPGMTRIDEIDVRTATPIEDIRKNIISNKDRKLPNVNDTLEWRETAKVAIVGGGPSLKAELDNLREYKYIFACGSVHDYLVNNNIIPTWCAVCDPDPIVLNYLTKPQATCKYFIASQCDPKVFEFLEGRCGNILLPGAPKLPHIIMWHLMGDNFDPSIYGDGKLAIGGGCTILTRAMVMVMGMGFYNLHLFGADTCLGIHNEHHAYDWSDPDKERIFDSTKVQFEVDGPIFNVAGYHLGQLFDIKKLCKIYQNRMQITVHGESLLHYFMELAQKRLALKKQMELENGHSDRLNGIGPRSIPSIEDGAHP